MGTVGDAATTWPCWVRVLNEVATGTLAGSTAQLLVNGTSTVDAGLYAMSPYAAAVCGVDGTPLAVSVGASAPVSLSLPAYATPALNYWTALIASGTDGSLQGALLEDSTGSPPIDSPVTIDVGYLRVIHAYAWAPAVTLNSNVDICYNCALPQLCNASFPGHCFSGSADAFMVSSAYGTVVQVSAYQPTAGGNAPLVTTTLFVDEHSVTTLVLHNAPAPSDPLLLPPASLGVFTDVAGRNAYAPIGIAFAVLLAAGIAHRLIGWLIGRHAVRAGWAPVPVRKGHVNVLSFFGWDKVAAKAVAAAAKARTDARAAGDAGSVNGGAGAGAFVVPLLGADDSSAADAEAGRRAAPAPVPVAATVTTAPKSAGRITSIDTFRGFALCIMVFVNAGGGNYTFFNHSLWDGLTVADLVFPWFVFMQGVSTAISFASERKKGATKAQLAYKTVVRAIKLFLLGMWNNSQGQSLDQWRVPGVLQYFGVSYLVIGLLETYLGPALTYGAAPPAGAAGNATAASAPAGADAHAASSSSSSSRSKSSRRAEPLEAAPMTWREALRVDLGRYWAQWLVMSVLLFVYLVVQDYLPVPGCPTGYIGAGGLADGGQYPQCTGGAHRYVDTQLFGAAHMYHSVLPDGTFTSAATCDDVYQCAIHDPEGALGWLTASWMAWLGLQAGRAIITYRHIGAAGTPEAARELLRRLATRWLSFGFVLCLLGGCLCGFSMHGGPYPLNKNLWSVSFVSTLAGWGFFILTGLYTLQDYGRKWTGTPFRYVGANSILVYLSSETVGGSTIPFVLIPHAVGWQNHAQALVSNLSAVIFWGAVARACYIWGFFVHV